jgi:hypothetical protein
MIQIRRARLPESLQALARRENGAVVVYVSATLPASERAAAIRRALRAATEAGWRSPRSPVMLPALAGAAGLPLAPEGRWTYRALVAAAAAAVIGLVTAIVLAGGSPAHHSAHSSTALRPTASPTRPGPAGADGPGSRTGSPAAPGAAPGTGPGAAPAGAPAGKRGTQVTTGKPATAGHDR